MFTMTTYHPDKLNKHKFRYERVAWHNTQGLVILFTNDWTDIDYVQKDKTLILTVISPKDGRQHYANITRADKQTA